MSTTAHPTTDGRALPVPAGARPQDSMQ